MRNKENFVAENPNQIILLRLKRLMDVELCNRLIKKKYEQNQLPIHEDIINKKAIGLASTIRSVLGYWLTETNDLNTWILSRYYAIFQMTIAEQVASINNIDTLEEIQKHTIIGHGLGFLAGNLTIFPNEFYVYILKSGHFSNYLKFKGISLNDGRIEKRLSSVPIDENERCKLTSITDLFRRIPELHPLIEEYFGTYALSFQVVSDILANSERKRTNLKVPNGKEITDLLIISKNIRNFESGIHDTLSSEFPFKNLKIKADSYNKEESYFSCEFNHPTDSFYLENLKTHKSSYCGTSIIIPILKEITEIELIHFMLLYSLSITVRYMPNLWYEVTSGKLSFISSLLEYYLTVLDNVMPNVFLEKITGVKTLVHQPGSLSAPM